MSEPIRDTMPGVGQCALEDLSATEVLGRRLAAMLRGGDSILLEGPLGAGKTALARALLRAACSDPGLEVPSPSYTLVQSYETPGFTISHFDLWRLDGPEGLPELGWDEAREGVVLVEWPDRLGPLVPADALTVRLEPVTDPVADLGADLGADIDADASERRMATLTGWDDRRAGMGL